MGDNLSKWKKWKLYEKPVKTKKFRRRLTAVQETEWNIQKEILLSDPVLFVIVTAKTAS